MSAEMMTAANFGAGYYDQSLPPELLASDDPPSPEVPSPEPEPEDPDTEEVPVVEPDAPAEEPSPA